MERYDLNAVPNASSEAAGVLRIANEVDEKNCGCKDAAITPSNLYNLLGYRKANTAYTGNEVVACPYHTEFLLKCVEAGTTSTSLLGTTNVTKGQVITDGGVKWEVIAKAIIDASISGKTITVTFADGTTKTLTTQDTNNIADYQLNSKNGYVKFNNGLIIQWGYTGSNTVNTVVTLPIPFSTNIYRVFMHSTYDTDSISNADASYAYRTLSVIGNKTTTNFKCKAYVQNASDWFAIGF